MSKVNGLMMSFDDGPWWWVLHDGLWWIYWFDGLDGFVRFVIKAFPEQGLQVLPHTLRFIHTKSQRSLINWSNFLSNVNGLMMGFGWWALMGFDDDRHFSIVLSRLSPMNCTSATWFPVTKCLSFSNEVRRKFWCRTWSTSWTSGTTAEKFFTLLWGKRISWGRPLCWNRMWTRKKWRLCD